MRTAIVTAIYGGYDRPKPLPADHGADKAILFTDNVLLAEHAATLGWDARVDDNFSDTLTPMLRAKYWKTHLLLAEPTFDVAVWLDGSMQITTDGFMGRCIAALGEDDLSMTLHPNRTCIYPEAEVTASLVRYADCDPMAQVAGYRAAGHPENWGLFASGAFTVRHNMRTLDWGRAWWLENIYGTYQDQLSLPVVMRNDPDLTWNTNMPWGQWWSLTEHGV